MILPQAQRPKGGSAGAGLGPLPAVLNVMYDTERQGLITHENMDSYPWLTGGWVRSIRMAPNVTIA
jgi:hypothetical protein